MTELIWRDPPTDGRRRVLTGDVISLLRANPGRWAVIRQYPNRTAVKGPRPVKHPADIELRSVEEPPGSVLYARARPNPKEPMTTRQRVAPGLERAIGAAQHRRFATRTVDKGVTCNIDQWHLDTERTEEEA